MSDRDRYARRDVWAGAATTLVEGGDCEDLALLKAASLEHLGWNGDGLAVVVGVSTAGGERRAHAVLLATLGDGTQLVLDTLASRVLAPRDGRDFEPMYATGRGRLWLVDAD